MMKNQYYPHLFSPIKIGNMELKNRIVQGASDFAAADYDGQFSQLLIDYYEQTARNGAGLIITGYASVEDNVPEEYGCMLKLTNRKQIAALSRLAQAVHKYGTKIFVQAYKSMEDDLTVDQLQEVVRQYGIAARILYDAGLDGIEVLAAGGNDYYLINRLLSPATNHRTDEYGGSFENRFRLLKEIIEEIRRQCPHDFIIDVRMNANEFMDEGYGLETGVRIAKALEEIGVDMLNVQNSHQGKGYLIYEPVNIPFGWKTDILRTIHESVSIPVMGTDVIKRPEQAEQLLRDKVCDMPVTVRMFMADPEWPVKARDGRSSEIRNCIGCLNCLDDTACARISTCAMNPTFLRDKEYPDRGRDLEGRKVIVVGAGPAGMEAAIVCSRRGADVTVYEKRDFIGGSGRLAGRTPQKNPMTWMVEYYEAMAHKLNIDVQLNREITAEEIDAADPYAVFIASGANPIILPTAGYDKKRVFTVNDVLSEELTFENKNIVVIGGGMTGCETAELYAMQGNNKVSVVEMRDALAPEVNPANLAMVEIHLKEHQADILTGHAFVKTTEDGVIVKRLSDDTEVIIPADIVILSLGGRPDRSLYDILREKRDHVFAIGDSRKVGRVVHATRTAYDAAYTLEP